MNYNKKLELARDWYNDQSTTKKEKVLLESLFPELKESEDERIRKEMITAFSRFEEDSTLCGVAYNYKKWIAWLEKQDPKKHEEELEKAYKCADEVQYRKGYEDAKRECEIENANKVRQECYSYEATNKFIAERCGRYPNGSVKDEQFKAFLQKLNHKLWDVFRADTSTFIKGI